MSGTLILLRHGESQWNKENRFTGWVDVELDEVGRQEAAEAGKRLKEAGLIPDIAFTSYLQRAVHTLEIVLETMELHVPITAAWQLNERHYGGLQGKNKAETAAIFGEEQVHEWRRSYSTPPPVLPVEDPMHPSHDPRYKDVPGVDAPFTESLKDTVARAVPYFTQHILPLVNAGETVLVAAHGNSLRGIIKHLEHISDADIPALELHTGVPYVYEIEAGKILQKKILQE